MKEKILEALIKEIDNRCTAKNHEIIESGSGVLGEKFKGMKPIELTYFLIHLNVDVKKLLLYFKNVDRKMMELLPSQCIKEYLDDNNYTYIETLYLLPLCYAVWINVYFLDNCPLFRNLYEEFEKEINENKIDPS